MKESEAQMKESQGECEETANFEQPKGTPVRLLGQQVLKIRHNARIVNSLRTFESGRRCSFSQITQGEAVQLHCFQQRILNQKI